MKLKTGDKVVVIAGKDKGKEGLVKKLFREDNKVIVDGINMIKKHVKPNGQTAGSITEMEAPIDASNVMIQDKKGNKVRVAKKSNEIIN